MTIEDINKNLQALDSIEPLIDYKEEPREANEFRNNEALAAMYVNEGFRSYLEQNLNAAIKATALRSITEVDSAAGKMRVLTLKELLVKSRRAYIGFEKLKKIKEQVEQKRKEKNNAV